MFRLLGGKKYGIIAVPGDPFVRPARARLIWANNTAQAVQNLGLEALLAADVQSVPVKFESLQGLSSIRRMVTETYNVPATYDMRGIYDMPSKIAKLSPGQWALDYDIPRSVFPYCGLLHTRHPVVLSRALKAGIPCVYEDHDEDHNNAFKKLPELVRAHQNLRVIVAITEAVRERLIKIGIPKDRTIVLDSGVNSQSLVRYKGEATQIRKSLLERGFDHIVVYSGGLQIERGIRHLLNAAVALPKSLFVLFGGNSGDQSLWRSAVVDCALPNVVVPGYVPQRHLLPFQQAADVLVMTREHDERAAITSPLKFFEYLAAGSPIVAASLPAVERYGNANLAAAFYNPANPETLPAILSAVMADFPWRPDGYAHNISLAHEFTWEQRQIALFRQLVS